MDILYLLCHTKACTVHGFSMSKLWLLVKIHSTRYLNHVPLVDLWQRLKYQNFNLAFSRFFIFKFSPYTTHLGHLLDIWSGHKYTLQKRTKKTVFRNKFWRFQFFTILDLFFFMSFYKFSVCYPIFVLLLLITFVNTVKFGGNSTQHIT